MKSKSIFVIALLSVVFLTSCGTSSKPKQPEKFVTSSSSTPESKTSETEATTEISNKESTSEISTSSISKLEETATMVSTQPNNDDIDFIDVNNCVSTEREESFTPNSSNDVIKYRIPRINLSSSDASRVNSEIREAYEKDFDNIHNSDDPAMYCYGIDYSYYTSNGVLSVVIGAHYYSNSVYHKVYNFDLSTGAQLDNNQLLDKLGKSFSDIKDNLKNAIREDYDNNYALTGPKNTYTQSLEQTLADSNLDNVKLFIGENSSLCAVCVEFVEVSAGEFEHIVYVQSN